MKVWLLTLKFLAEEVAFIVEAKTEAMARKKADEAVFDRSTTKGMYLLPEFSDCVELKLTGHAHVLGTVVDGDPYR